MRALFTPPYGFRVGPIHLEDGPKDDEQNSLDTRPHSVGRLRMTLADGDTCAHRLAGIVADSVFLCGQACS